MTAPGRVRVDVWLWSVRVYRTRSAASAACTAGHVEVNGEKAKPATRVGVGDEVVARVGHERTLVVRGLLTKRVGAAVAQAAVEDRTPPPPPREERPADVLREAGAGRPTKRDRRALERLRGWRD